MGLFPLQGLLHSPSEKSDVPLIITPSPLVHSSAHLKKIRAETLTTMREQNNERFLDFVAVNLSLPMTLFSSLPIVSADSAGHAVINALSRRRGFADFRRSDLHVFPLLFFQAVLTVFYALTSSSLLTQFRHTRLVYATVSAFMCACALGWALVGLHCFFLSRASLTTNGTSNQAEEVPQQALAKDTGADEEEPAVVNNAQNTQDVERCRTEAEIVAHTLLFHTHHPVPDWLLHLEILWLVVLFCSVYLLFFVFCEETIANPSNPVTPKPSRISDSILALSLLLPTFGYLLVKVLSFRLAFLLWLCSVVYTLALILSFGFTQSWSPLVIFSCLSLFLLVKVHRKDWLSFVLATDLRLALIENTLQSEEIKSNELKHMLGNIAHDLKTPMSCVVSGLELLSSLAGELRQHLRSHDEASLENLSGRVETISELASSLEHTNALMAMTINRCLDYHRTIHGQQLVPHIEPVPLETALLMPVHCLQNIMPGVNVQVVFSPPALRKERVFTDKHWLHDNLVCLIGNALKYSQRQPVLVRVSQLLVPRTDSSLLTGERALVGGEHKERQAEFTQRTKADEDSGEEMKELLDDIEAQMFIPTGREEIVHIRRSFSFASREELKQERKEEEEKLERGEWEALAYNLTPTAEHRQMVLFEALDRGPGLGCQYNDLSAVFGEPSQTCRPAGGSGLGLFSLARRVSTLGGHYGTHPRTDEPQGCCFWFSLPFDGRGSVALSPLSRETSLQVQGAQSTPEELSSPSLPPASPPLLSRSASQVSLEEEAITPTPSVPLSLPSLHVLVVDDSAVITRMASMLLKRHGHRVCTAENGLVALQLLRRSLHLKPLRFSGEAAITPVPAVAAANGALLENEKLSLTESEHIASLSSAFSAPVDDFPRVDVVLMDFQMPVMSGVEAIRRIRALEEQLAGKDKVARNFGFSRPHLPVRHKIIGISAKSDPDEISQAFEAGMNAFMAKPFTMELFYQTLNSIN